MDTPPLFLFSDTDLESARRRARDFAPIKETKRMNLSTAKKSTPKSNVVTMYRPDSVEALHEMLTDALIGARREDGCALVDIVLTGPLAKALIDQGNKGNRNIRAKNVARYRASMKAKKWSRSVLLLMVTRDANGAPVVRIGDGQHRLLALVDAGLPVLFQVEAHDDVRLFERRVFEVDCGGTRSMADNAPIMGLCNKNEAAYVAAVYNALADFDGSRPDDRALNQWEIRERAGRIASSLRYAVKAAGMLRIKGRGQAYIGAGIALAHSKHPAVVERAVEAAADGCSLRRGTAAHLITLHKVEMVAASTRREQRNTVAKLLRFFHHDVIDKPAPGKRIELNSDTTEEAVGHFVADLGRCRWKREHGAGK